MGVWVGLSSKQVESSSEERPRSDHPTGETNLEGPRVTKEPGLTSVARVPHTDGRYAARTPLPQPRRRRWGVAGEERVLDATMQTDSQPKTRHRHARPLPQAPPTNLPPQHHTTQDPQRSSTAGRTTYAPRARTMPPLAASASPSPSTPPPSPVRPLAAPAPAGPAPRAPLSLYPSPLPDPAWSACIWMKPMADSTRQQRCCVGGGGGGDEGQPTRKWAARKKRTIPWG
jgi:hypothetical protein